MPVTYRPRVDAAFQVASIDNTFIEQIEATEPPGSAFYQLPYIAFPQSTPMVQIVPIRGIFAAKRLCAKLPSIR